MRTIHRREDTRCQPVESSSPLLSCASRVARISMKQEHLSVRAGIPFLQGGVDVKSGNRTGPRAVKMLDIYSGEELQFTSIGEAAKHFQTHTSHIFQAISKTPYPRVFQKRYQVAYNGDNFPVMTVAEKERAKSHGRKKVLAYNVGHRKYYVFSSAVEFIRTAQLSKKSVTVNLKKNQLREIGGWVTVYLSDENAKLLKSRISGPADI